MMDSRLQDLERQMQRSDRNIELLREKLEKLQDRMDRKIDEGLWENQSFTFRLFSIAMIWVLLIFISLIFGLSRVGKIM